VCDDRDALLEGDGVDIVAGPFAGCCGIVIQGMKHRMVRVKVINMNPFWCYRYELRARTKSSAKEAE